jgi:branched-chain amino acid transport system permease protein
MARSLKPKRWDWQVVLLLALVCLAALLLPDWMLFPISAALASAIAALGVAVLMKTGNITFGQSLPLCVGSYTAALLPRLIGVNDLFLNCLLAGLAAGVVNFILGAFMKRYSGIFFAMLTLAFSMVLYGSLANVAALGGTDGFNAPAPSLIGYAPLQDIRPSIMLLGAGAVAAAALYLTNRFLDSRIGWIARAVGANDIRVTYLGADVRSAVWVSIVYSGVLAGVGGALNAAITGHVTPETAYWTHSGELVLIAILGNSSQAIAIFAASLMIEAMRVVSSAMFPYTWQGGLGIMLLAIVLLLPNGLDSWFRRLSLLARARRPGGSA